MRLIHVKFCNLNSWQALGTIVLASFSRMNEFSLNIEFSSRERGLFHYFREWYWLNIGKKSYRNEVVTSCLDFPSCKKKKFDHQVVPSVFDSRNSMFGFHTSNENCFESRNNLFSFLSFYRYLFTNPSFITWILAKRYGG